MKNGVVVLRCRNCGQPAFRIPSAHGDGLIDSDSNRWIFHKCKISGGSSVKKANPRKKGYIEKRKLIQTLESRIDKLHENRESNITGREYSNEVDTTIKVEWEKEQARRRNRRRRKKNRKDSGRAKWTVA